MKISKLVKKLNELKKVHGNLDVVVSDCGNDYSVEYIEFTKVIYPIFSSGNDPIIRISGN